MKTTIQIKSIFGKLLFEFEKENNSIKNTLTEAVKKGANLEGANLNGAYLEGANLKGAYLEGANLYGAYLNGAYLNGANLYGAYLNGAYLNGANLNGANLNGAYLEGANLNGANLNGAYLEGANLKGAYLEGANLEGANLKRIATLFSILPEGELIVWKKLQNNLIAKLLIPKKAKRVNAISSRKCRFEFAKVIAIYDGKKKVNEGYGIFVNSFLYKVDEIVRPDKFDPDPLVECSNGIHAFITRLEAEEYN